MWEEKTICREVVTRLTAHWHSCRWTAELFYYTITFTCSPEVSVRMECVSLAKQNIYFVVHKVQTKHEWRFVVVIGQTMILSHSSRALRFVCCHLCKGATIAGVMWHPRSWTLCSTVLNWTFPKGSWKMVSTRQSCWFCSMLFSLTWNVMNLTCDRTGSIQANLCARSHNLHQLLLPGLYLFLFSLSPPTQWSLQASWLCMKFKVKSIVCLRLARWMSETSEILSNAWLLSGKLHLDHEPNFTIYLLNNKITHPLHCIWMVWCNKVTRVRLNIPTDVQFRCQKKKKKKTKMAHGYFSQLPDLNIVWIECLECGYIIIRLAHINKCVTT